MNTINTDLSLFLEILDKKVKEAFSEYDEATRGFKQFKVKLRDAENVLRKHLIEYYMRVSKGKVGQSADRMGINRNTLRRLMTDFGIDRRDFIIKRR